jgi:uncharacterized protein involved in response to NO
VAPAIPLAPAPAPGPSPPPRREPYAFFFPVGAALGIVGAGLWSAAALGLVSYPATPHAILMIEGFEAAFVTGFLLTVLPRFTRTDAGDRRELPWALAAVVGVGAAALAGQVVVAHGLFAATLLLLVGALVRRLHTRRNDPPVEFLAFGPLALAFGLIGALLELAVAMGWAVDPSARLGLRLVSLGMVLSLVLGIGALLVPVFLEIKDPLVIPRIAKPHERPARRALYGALGGALALSFALDALHVARAGPWLRVAVAGSVLLGVWKLWRVPGRRTVPAFVLWSAGWLVLAGLVLAAALSRHEIAAMHITLLGGFGALTMAIASRVVVTHGGHGPAAEDRLVTPLAATLLALALAARLTAEARPSEVLGWLGLSGALWMLAWLGWLARALRFLRR